MPISSDTLFHFTKTIESLKTILKSRFHPTYCKESCRLDYETHDNYYPLISFCDIPLSLAGKQIKNYGSYAIGMTKKWGITNGLNPMLYVESDSLLAKDIQKGLDDTIKLGDKISSVITQSSSFIKSLIDSDLTHRNKEELKIFENRLNEVLKKPKDEISMPVITELKEKLEEFKAFNKRVKGERDNLAEYKTNIEQVNNLFSTTAHSRINQFRYIKNYEGDLIRKNKTIKNYRFYDEREWRYVPAVNDKRVRPWISKDEFEKYRGTKKVKPLLTKIKLGFTSDDIQFLLVKSTADIPKLIHTIKNTSGLTKNAAAADILSTKILTVDQLNADF